MMGALADAAMSAGGDVTGVIPRQIVDLEVGHTGVGDLRIVDSMHERKALMAELADAFVALPGGIGTLEELFEVFTWAHLGLHHKPLGLLDVAGYYRPLEAMLDHAVEQRFLRAETRAMLVSDDSFDGLLARFEAWRPGARAEVDRPRGELSHPGYPAAREDDTSSSGTSGSASRARSTVARSCTSAWIGSLTSQTFTFMPATSVSAAEPEGDELAGAHVAADDELVRSRVVQAGVLHPDVVLVGEEVRDLVVAHVLAEHRARRRRALLEGVGPVLDADVAAEHRVRGVGDVARGEDALDARLQPLVDDDAVVDPRDIREELGPRRDADADDDRGAVDRAAVGEPDALRAAVALDRLDAGAEPQVDPLLLVDVAVEGAELGAQDAQQRQLERLDDRDVHALLARGRRDLAADPAAADHDEPAASVEASRGSRSSARSCAAGARRRGRRRAREEPRGSPPVASSRRL